MNVDAYLPTALLAPFIKRYRIIECQGELVNRVVPDTSLVMSFRYKGQVSYLTDDTQTYLPTSVVSGLRKSGRLINYAKNKG